MENQDRNEVLSRAVKAGKRTYFFDVKRSRNEEMYLTITESKRKFNADSGNFFYEISGAVGMSLTWRCVDESMSLFPVTDDYTDTEKNHLSLNLRLHQHI